MKTTFLETLLVAGLIASSALTSFAADAKEDTYGLEPWVHTAVRHEFCLKKDAPLSDDGKYRLKEVRANGEVELLELSDPKNPKPVVAKPRSPNLKRGERPPTLWVHDFDAKKQSATLCELRFK
ncbi:MAG: hypothetical protein JNK23_16415 [Opitutaceae bacterium]|nr:hypothetical protein [Opitutaceae bacterium]